MKYLIILLAIISVSSCKPKEGKLSGVITYYFNENYGNKPDVGAEILLIDADSIDIKPIKDFQSHRASYQLQETRERNYWSSMEYLQENKERLKKPYVKGEFRKDIEKFIAELEEKTKIADTLTQKEKDDFKISDSLAFTKYLEFERIAQKFVADGNGNYSISLPSKKSYHVLIKSNHRKSISLMDLGGQTETKTIKIEPEKTTTFNQKFDL